MKIQQPVKHKARIELIPMLDTIFLLLVFFIYAMLSLTVHRGIDVELPASKGGEINREEFADVSFNSEGRYYIDKEEMPIAEIIPRLLERKNENPNLKITISGDRAAEYGKSIELLDALRNAGFDNVFFRTKLKR